MHPPQTAQIRALVSLLSDENPHVVAEARRALREHGECALRQLDVAIRDGDAKLRARARICREEVRLRLLQAEFRACGQRLDRDESALEDACFLIARTRDDGFDPDSVRAALDAMADDLVSRLRHRDPPSRVVRVLIRLLAHELGFHGNQRNYYDPDNSYLHTVLERRAGIPISLSAVYLFVARRAGIPLVGIGMPGHFLVRHADAEPALFIDPFSSGRVLTESDCLRYLEDGDFGWDPTWLSPMTDGAIVLRMLRNLLLIFRSRGDRARQSVLLSLKRALVGEEVSDPELSESDGER